MIVCSPSPAAISLIEHFEIGDSSSYISHPIWPGGASGVTIGIGYDLGYASVDQISQDWNELSSSTLIKIQSYAGIFGNSAKNIINKSIDINITFSQARHVFEDRDIPRVSLLTLDAFANVDKLSSDSFGALVSLVFNRGTSMSDTSPGNRLEMRQIRDVMKVAEFGLIPDFIRSMKRLWLGKGLDGLLARRDAEAALFENGLCQQQKGLS